MNQIFLSSLDPSPIPPGVGFLFYFVFFKQTLSWGGGGEFYPSVMLSTLLIRVMPAVVTHLEVSVAWFCGALFLVHVAVQSRVAVPGWWATFSQEEE